MLKQIIINNKIITEGDFYRHNNTGIIYQVKKHKHGILKLDKGILSVNITPEKLTQITKIV